MADADTTLSPGQVLNRLAEAVADTDDLESLVRPLLELLEAITGLESTYLTSIDRDQRFQHIIYSRNTRELEIPEGLSVPWGDTLCGASARPVSVSDEAQRRCGDGRGGRRRCRGPVEAGGSGDVCGEAGEAG